MLHQLLIFASSQTRLTLPFPRTYDLGLMPSLVGSRS
jgi:hypothetical protein